MQPVSILFPVDDGFSSYNNGSSGMYPGAWSEIPGNQSEDVSSVHETEAYTVVQHVRIAEMSCSGGFTGGNT